MTTEPTYKKSIIVLYHSGCTDGYAAAWAAWKKFGAKAECIALQHQLPPDKRLKNKDVYLLDITYFDKALDWVIKNNKNVTIIDHHEQALPSVKKAPFYFYANDHSGATLAWTFFHPKKKIPRALLHIEEMDLWKFRRPFTKELMSALERVPREFPKWSKFITEVENPKTRKQHIQAGKTILQYQESVVKSLVEKASSARIGKYRVGVVNSPILASEIGHALYSRGYDIGIVWAKKSKRYHISLRSSGKIDVARLAKRYGGGGHKAAAGIKLPLTKKFPWRYTES